MISVRSGLLLVASVLLLFPGDGFSAEEQWGPVKTHCDAKTGLNGAAQKCEADPACYTVPSGYALIPSTINVQAGRRYGGKDYGCVHQLGGFVSEGATIKAKSVCVRGSAHSPSGPGNIGSRGGVECSRTGYMLQD
jgi:hypothetical protein